MGELIPEEDVEPTLTTEDYEFEPIKKSPRQMCNDRREPIINREPCLIGANPKSKNNSDTCEHFDEAFWTILFGAFVAVAYLGQDFSSYTQKKLQFQSQRL